jgi:hypothetical protein
MLESHLKTIPFLILKSFFQKITIQTCVLIATIQEKFVYHPVYCSMEQHTLRNVNNHLNTNIYNYLETSGGQSSNQYLKVVHFFNTSVN